ncbi:hypothetical protein GCM10007242_36250 [Pigmentiphaga litoralis]|uniref:alginate lyase family protein n=1 Tax=Pigmentiphaga litoralis TaxID=516702 RepID=UPI00167AB86E|nr:alginate lyase family protein [Pigmentiphaga litoralis]GGX25302.1 hypothetical protein GCM10007242_36250 [Pigmentiphaga litoralis]
MPTPPVTPAPPATPVAAPAAYTRAAGGIGEFLCPVGWDRLRTLAAKDKQMDDIVGVMRGNSAALLTRVPAPVRWLPNQDTDEQPVKYTPTSDENAVARKALDADFGSIAALGYTWSFDQRADQLEALRRILLAWAAVNEPYGNPLAEHKLLAPAKAYYQVRHALPAIDRDVIDAWFRKMMVRNRQWVEKSRRFNNWHAHGICNVAVAALVIDDLDHLKWVEESTKALLAVHIEPGGATFDFRQRDALSYHNYSLEGLLMINQVLNIHGIDLYRYEHVAGAGTMAKAMAFIVPYIKGEKVHYEFVNTTYGPDITGIHKNEYNTRWTLTDIWAIRRADAYEPAYGDFVRTLMKTTYPKHPLTWRFPEWHENYLLNEVTRDLKAYPFVPG